MGKSGRLTFVPTPIGNPEDITMRSRRALEEADLIYAEHTDRARTLLATLGIKFSGKIIHVAQEEEQKFAERYLSDMEDGAHAVMMSDAGMPGVNDPGLYLLQAARARGIDTEILPGPSSVLLGFVSAAFPMPWTFQGFWGRSDSEKNLPLDGTHLYFIPPHRLLKFLETLPADASVFLGKDLTKEKYERLLSGTSESLLVQLKSEEIRGEWLAVISIPQKEISQETLADWLTVIPSSLSNTDALKIIKKATNAPKRMIYEFLLEKRRNEPS